MTEAEIKARAARYNRIERVADDAGRIIGVKRLKPSQQLRVQELAPSLEGTTAVVDEDPDSPTFGKTMDVPKSMPLYVAASVVEIDGSPVTFPKSRVELDAVIDVLDQDGLKAAGEALAKLSAAETGGEADPKDVAGNVLSDPGFRQACWLIKNGVAFDTAFALLEGGPVGEGEAMAFAIAFGEFEGGEFDLKSWSWRERT